jgi:hypothetical protein
MNSTFNSLLIRYQNYFLEFYQLIEDKNLITSQQPIALQVKHFLENLPEFAEEFDLGFSLSKVTGGLRAVWSLNISDNGFSVRSFSIDDLDEIEEWYFHYHDHSKEYEGNLFTDGDWDLFLEEVAAIDDRQGEQIFAEFNYAVGDQ